MPKLLLGTGRPPDVYEGLQAAVRSMRSERRDLTPGVRGDGLSQAFGLDGRAGSRGGHGGSEEDDDG
ncbi:hypothetical protein DPEC_G00333900 [Dallia pectoralis]|uniref:Uncharacterized protein n=1 Tax=Dallia pectoralis TaxID=75939 RepID=A0ACC2F6J3_DALPE|nr:hypothetical protein DPEC_G00333900 [Dallia pectoralis]